MDRIRRAFYCDHKQHEGTPKRVFLTPDEPRDYVPVCHGRMKRQSNRPYRGKPTRQ